MTKTPIKIPFEYANGDLMCYVDSGYVNRLIWFDTETKKFFYNLPEEPSKKVWWYKEATNIEKAELLYSDRYKEYLAKKQDFEDGVESGTIIEAPRIIWKDNFIFEDTLFVDSYTRGRSAADFILVSIATGIKYSMFLRDSLDMIQHAKISYGSITGKWTFCKRGANFGIKYIEEDVRGDIE